MFSYSLCLIFVFFITNIDPGLFRHDHTLVVWTTNYKRNFVTLKQEFTATGHCGQHAQDPAAEEREPGLGLTAVDFRIRTKMR